MKIWIINLHAIPPQLGGLVRHYYFTKYLKKKEHEVKIFTSSKIHNSSINFIEKEQEYVKKIFDGIEYTFIKNRDYHENGIKRIFNLLEFSYKILKLKKSYERPDIIYVSVSELIPAISAIILGKRYKIPCVVEIRDIWPESLVEYAGVSKSNVFVKLLYQVERWVYKNADELIFTFPGGKQYIKDKKWTRGIDPRKIHHVTNGVDIEEFEYNKGEFQISDPLLEDENIFKVVYTGSVRKANDIKKLVKAMEYLKEEKDIHLFLYGDGHARQELEEYCQKNGLNQVHFKGFIEKKYIPYILFRSDLNILNYQKSGLWKYGGSQNKFAEYLASQKPILSNIKMGYSVIEKYNCGYENNVETAKEYADIIYKFYKMPREEYEEVCHNSKRALKEYDYKRLSKKIERILVRQYEKNNAHRGK